jgi:TonB family protein
MKNALLISFIGHLALFFLLWLGGLTFSKPRLQGYPLKINAVLVEKSSVSGPPSASSRRSVSSQKPLKKLPEAKKSTPAPQKPKSAPQPQKTSEISEVSGAPAATSLSIDALEFPFPQYLNLVQYRVERQWLPPATPEKEISCIVFFRIKRNGQAAEVTLAKSSGHFDFDQAGLRAVFNAAPFPPLPAESTSEFLGVHFEFVGRK